MGNRGTSRLPDELTNSDPTDPVGNRGASRLQPGFQHTNSDPTDPVGNQRKLKHKRKKQARRHRPEKASKRRANSRRR